MHNLRRLAWTLGKQRSGKTVNSAFDERVQCLSRCVTPGEKHSRRPSHTIPLGEMGQPTCHTHPHLIPSGHLTHGITQAEYIKRRDTLIKKLMIEAESDMSHIVVIPGAVKQYMSEKIPYVFRQNSDFFYLTGCLEPGAVLVLIKPQNIDHYSAVLFVSEKDKHEEMWEGPRTGCTAATKLFGVHDARPIDTLENYLKQTSSLKPCRLWYHQTSPSNLQVDRTVRKIIKLHDLQHSDPERIIHFMRVIKSPAEISLLKEACRIGAQSVNVAMACTKPGISEHAINAVLEFSSRQAGAEHLAFPPVVAGGNRATHIHYVANNQILNEGDLLLVDTGCQRWLYNSDISRTWPVSGKFSKHQKILYEIVLSTQKRLIQLLNEQRQPLDQLFDQMCRLLGTYLQQESILPKHIDSRELVQRAYQLCPHHVSHYLGLDVHDSSLVKRNIGVQTNMLVTVEPGLYIRSDDLSVPEEFRGVGIRIEDDVLVTDGDCLVLTEAAAKEVDDIEAVVGQTNIIEHSDIF